MYPSHQQQLNAKYLDQLHTTGHFEAYFYRPNDPTNRKQHWSKSVWIKKIQITFPSLYAHVYFLFLKHNIIRCQNQSPTNRCLYHPQTAHVILPPSLPQKPCILPQSCCRMNEQKLNYLYRPNHSDMGLYL